ncbi:MAG TPA: hypothetical protein VG123_24510 [Streptosporangiaceae bacterium]|nr:hypothetical protein [Streptosporangiaceae bacterium]
MSSAILYLAIVAIWAVVLVPRWLRPRHTTSRTLESQLTEPPGHRQLEDFAWTDEDEADQDGYAGSFGEADLVRAETGTGWPGPGVAGPAGRRGPEREHEAVAAGPPAPPAAPSPEQDDGQSPAQRQARILQARRRMLITLLVLTGGAVGIVVTHLAATWVVLPPGVLLAGFVLLLREAARSDAQRARAGAARPRAGAGPATSARSAQAGAVPDTGRPDAEPGAQIIDISARVGDQLYDQYADAARRAVGD